MGIVFRGLLLDCEDFLVNFLSLWIENGNVVVVMDSDDDDEDDICFVGKVSFCRR